MVTEYESGRKLQRPKKEDEYSGPNSKTYYSAMGYTVNNEQMLLLMER